MQVHHQVTATYMDTRIGRCTQITLHMPNEHRIAHDHRGDLSIPMTPFMHQLANGIEDNGM
jgi:hypothetical protein